MAGNRMGWELSGPVFVIVHTALNPSDAEYDDTLGGYARHLGQFNGILIYTDGGAPNPLQRKRTTDFWQGKTLPRTAIMASSVMVRGVIMALNWFLPQEVTAVKQEDFEGAFAYLGTPAADRAAVEKTVQRLRSSLGAAGASASA